MKLLSQIMVIGLSGVLSACGGGGAAPAPVVSLAITSFTATPSNAQLGQTVTLAWQVTGASALAVDQGVGAVTGSSVVVTPGLGGTTYELLATGGGASVSRSTEVNVQAVAAAPVINRFSASALSITAGDAVTLSFEVTGATSLSITPGVGPVTGTSVRVTPTANTVYSLSAVNAAGAAESSLAVNVSGVASGITEQQFAPSVTANAGAISDTFGNHVATVPSGTRVGRLFVHLPGSGGRPTNSLLVVRDAANQGLHAIGLAYPNIPTVDSLCTSSSDAACYESVRLEIIDGTDRTPLTSVNRNNSIENRLIAALTYLAAQSPGQGWEQYLAGGAVQWGSVIVSGHSQGGGHAALMARDRVLARVCMFGAPKDYSTFFNAPAAWQNQPHVTPTERYWGFNHQQDSQVTTLRNWAALGMNALGAPVNVDTSAPPYANSRQLTTNAVPAQAGQFHGSVVVDRSTPLAANGSPLFLPVWRQMCFQ